MYFNYLYFNYFTTLVLVVGVFLWGQIFAQWSNLPFFTLPKEHFSMGAIIFHGCQYQTSLVHNGSSV